MMSNHARSESTRARSIKIMAHLAHLPIYLNIQISIPHSQSTFSLQCPSPCHRAQPSLLSEPGLLAWHALSPSGHLASET